MLKQQKNKIPNESICLNCIDYPEKLCLTFDRSSTLIKGRQTIYDKPTNSEGNLFSKLDKEIPVFNIEMLNLIIDRDIAELGKDKRCSEFNYTSSFNPTEWRQEHPKLVVNFF